MPLRDKERIVVAGSGKIESLDPAQANTIRTLQLISALGDTFYKLDKSGNLIPVLAKEPPKITNKGMALQIKLKENIFFHDGTLLDAKAMEFSLNRFMKIGTLNYLIKDKVKKIKAIDKFTVRIG